MRGLSVSPARAAWGCTLVASLLAHAACQSTGGASGADRESVDAVDRRIWFAAAEDGNAKLLQALIDDGIDAGIESGGLTALHVAARNGTERSCRFGGRHGRGGHGRPFYPATARPVVWHDPRGDPGSA